MPGHVDDFDDPRGIAQASSTSMTILEPSGEGPKEERYVSTNQIRHPLQAVCSNIAET